MISSFEQCDINQVIIIFGQTKFTAKECFIINFPECDNVQAFVLGSSNQADMVRKVIM